MLVMNEYIIYIYKKYVNICLRVFVTASNKLRMAMEQTGKTYEDIALLFGNQVRYLHIWKNGKQNNVQRSLQLSCSLSFYLLLRPPSLSSFVLCILFFIC